MPKKKMVELVNRLKQSGINISLTKPKSNYHLSILANHQCTVKSFVK